MASPVRNARLRAPGYTVVPHSPDTSIPVKDIIFRLNVSRIQKDIASGAEVLFLPGFINETLHLGILKYVITIEGKFVEDGTHQSHTTVPVVTATEHVPDFIDLEEATFLFNHDGSRKEKNNLAANLVELQIEYGEDGNSTNPNWRIYKGLILSTELVLTAGHWSGDFIMQFGVAWSEDSPTLREWA